MLVTIDCFSLLGLTMDMIAGEIENAIFNKVGGNMKVRHIEINPPHSFSSPNYRWNHHYRTDELLDKVDPCSTTCMTNPAMRNTYSPFFFPIMSCRTDSTETKFEASPSTLRAISTSPSKN